MDASVPSALDLDDPESATISTQQQQLTATPPPPTPLYPDLDQSLVDNVEFRTTVLRNFGCPFRAEATCRFEVCVCGGAAIFT